KKECLMKSDLERTELNKEKTGVFTGSYAINPVNGKSIPIWISDYVLASYGTGAIMAVPAHDERDFEFAKKFGIDIIPVIQGENTINIPYTGDGIHINSGFLNGLNKDEAIKKMIKYLEENGFGSKKINYRIREWIFARQRYWGEPIPVIYLEDGTVKLDDKLPLVLPTLDDYSPCKNGSSPLEKATNWVNTKVNGVNGKRETSTMPGSAGSSWYFLRYIDPHNNKEIADKRLLEHWMPVDLYVGGSEHAVGHLLYSRMWNNYLYDKGIVPVKEPFKKLVHQGMILGSNGIKMGKRFPDYVVEPNKITKSHGSDALRFYEMFMGPIEADKPWDYKGIDGSLKFLDRVYRLYTQERVPINGKNDNLERIYNQTIKKVTEDYEKLSFNTAISYLMVFINAVYKEDVFPVNYAEGFLKLLNPVAPHITEELWQNLGHNNTISYELWPLCDESKILKENFDIAVQVNGKLRATINISINDDENIIKEKALSNERIINYIQDKDIIKVIVIKNKIVNIVIKG
ncbi:MAG: class I tRNA ligase family protein, partial [Bacilli bacterium]